MDKVKVRLSELWIYPLKSARGIRLETAKLTPMGFENDRRWMLVNPEGRFLSQRELPAMAQLEMALTPQGLSCRYQESLCTLPFLTQAPSTRSVKVWRSEVPAWVYPDATNQWFSERLKTPCQLVYMPDSTFRETNPRYAPGKRVSFADGYPYLLANQSALDLLNQRLQKAKHVPITMERFRPNMVLEGDSACGEHHWKTLQFPASPCHNSQSNDSVRFEVVKACERCVMVNNNPASGERYQEPLRTLHTYNRVQEKIIFGQNACSPNKIGSLTVGMKGYIHVH